MSLDFDAIIDHALAPVVARLRARIAELTTQPSRPARAAKQARPAPRRASRKEIHRWAADARARRVPNFVIELTGGLDTKKKVVAAYGPGAVFEKGKPIPKKLGGWQGPRDQEGRALENLVATLYEERGRKGVGDFGLPERIQGYWDRADTELDLVAVAGDDEILRLVGCKRSPEKLVGDLPRFDGHVGRFLAASPKFCAWTIAKVAVTPSLDQETRRRIQERGYIPEVLNDLGLGLRRRRGRHDPDPAEEGPRVIDDLDQS
jgi:hypothetical protein